MGVTLSDARWFGRLPRQGLGGSYLGEPSRRPCLTLCFQTVANGLELTGRRQLSRLGVPEPDMTVQILTLLVALLAGGAMGALITERFRRRRGRTRAIPVIERVNRNPVASELKGIKLFRLPAGPGEAPVEINNIREYQLTLRNTSDRDLRGAEIQFEFSSASTA